MSDLNKKTLRHFYCRDVLWQCFERMSEDFDRGVDDLVNEAMRVFAREKGYIPAEADVRATSQNNVVPHSTVPRPPPLPPPSRPSQQMPRLTGSAPRLATARARRSGRGLVRRRRSTSSSRTSGSSSTRSSSSSGAGPRPRTCPSVMGTSRASTRR
jgi:hypothetical protein